MQFIGKRCIFKSHWNDSTILKDGETAVAPSVWPQCVLNVRNQGMRVCTILEYWLSSQQKASGIHQQCYAIDFIIPN